MSRPATRTLLASFMENAAKDCVTPLERERFAVPHYGDEKMEAGAAALRSYPAGAARA
jgi:hypothetical protein